ncbi:class I SAM-dependent methyltransferase [Roseospira marina]|uniref:Class I SAM-dependent methyltransferase n=1 Tax=Roseospira marina TaxID=140057 RepID=A0A5M6IGI3_9PROT|nr:SAM-dependent methyltransferase [Roseospira marina]KAA5607420.1 class I SAM-dependent methyltransferase [Roseospira marina]MBB4312405.1 SAM-dependent MidA family methyltransferase [Roseospira marina]MBB5085579.1 SAM-dependent MidA family methyltransferase [Roseospira marina]
MISTPSLDTQLRQRIAAEGPLAVETVMAEANAAYYARGEAIGAAGDFVTAPEISQVFGELIGLWLAVVWQMLGAPERVLLVECGPGRGTLMADALRALAPVPAFRAAVEVHLVETSPVLRETQRAALGAAVTAWHDTLDTVPEDAPVLLVANEFVDALPVRQYVRAEGAWHLRRIGLDADGAPVFVVGEAVPADDLAPRLRAGVPERAIAEVCPAGRAFAADVARRVTAQGGAGLIIDYGHGLSATGDTLQSVRAHNYHPVLRDLGSADLTTHVDFEALGHAAVSAGGCIQGPIEQGAWLRALGVEARAAALRRTASPDQDRAIHLGVRRLIDPAEMGRLFRVIAVATAGLATLPGFEGT